SATNYKPGSSTSPSVTEKLVADTGSSSTDHVTSNASLSGTADANAIVKFAVDGTPISATAKADAKGAWSFTPSGLADGHHTVVASEPGDSGLAGSASLSFTLDTKAPVPTIRGMVQSNGDVSLNGSAGGTAGEVVSIYDGDKLAGTATTASDGSFGFTTSA